MTNSGLIVFLPLVGAVVGAIIGAWANSWYRDREAKRMQQRECKGLLALITSEVIFNKAVLETILELASHDHMEDAATKTVSALRTKFGDKVLDRLAQLLPNEDLAKLNNYYLDIRLFRLFFTPSADAATLSPETKHAVEKLMAATDAVISVTKNY